MRGELVATCACLWLCSGVAHAADVWTDPHPGVRMLKRSTSTPWKIVALEVDLCHDGVKVRATKSAERQRTVSSFADLVDADAAINGDFFSFDDYSTSGLAVGAGEPWADTADGNGSGFIAFGLGRAEVSMPAVVVDSAPSWVRELVSGRRPLVNEGVPYPMDEGDLCTVRHPRTAAGLSQDGRTAYLVVVDGRSTASVGMRCTELADLMVDLGAWNAVNLDGGGSSAMWVRGSGVVNVPSDGSQRVVANHLALVASGAGEPGSCDRSWEESTLHGEVVAASTTTDLDADGDADLCARAASGVRCWRAQDGAFVEEIVGPALADESGWDAPGRYGTLRMGDLDGDGDADLCGRDGTGVRCFLSDGAGFPDEIAGPALADEAGWDDAKYHGTLRMADVDADGRDDLCARAAAGLHCWRSTGEGFSEPFVLADLSDDNGFAAMAQYGTIRMADVDADARIDVCARTAEGMRCWPSTGDGFAAPIVGPEWSDASGWGRVQYWSTIRLVDIDGDRKADLCGRSSAGLRCHLGTGSGFGEVIEGPAWSDESGWGDYANYSTIRFGDIDGDADLDVCARANAGVRCHLWEAGAFAAEAIPGPELSDETGWGSIRFFSTMRLVDLDADGAEEICARAGAGIRCWSYADGFATPVEGPPWSDDTGWGAPQYYETIRGVTPTMHCVLDERCGDGIDDDCDGEIDEDCSADDSGGGEADDGPGTEDGDDTGASTAGSEDGGTLPGTFGESEDAAGCACRTSARDQSALWLVPLVALARRRRR